MFGYRLDFQHPWYLLLLAVLPVLVYVSWPALRGLGPVRRVFALGLRTLMLVLLICALAELQVVRTSDRVAVIYLLDQSLSIPAEQRRAMLEYVNAEIRKHRDDYRKDKAGVIVFGADPAIEIPLFDDTFRIGTIESLIDREHTNLAGAMRLAQASFGDDASRRVVIISDGNENLGNAVEQARVLTEAGIGIDVVPIRYRPRIEIAVEKVTIPPDVNRGQPFDLKVVVNNTAPANSEATAHGRLRIVRKTSTTTETLDEREVTLPPGKHVFSIQQTVDSPDFYTYEARFVPAEGSDDALAQNNTATAFTHVRGQGQVLLIYDADAPGEFDRLIAALKRENLQVTIQSTNELFTSLPQLQPFDTVILANVPREAFSDEQIKMLVRNTQQMGAGLIMLGGPNSFGAGGWKNTELEAAMPVDFQIKNAKVKAIGALAMLMHASEMAQGNYWQKVVGKKAIEALGNEDYCGVIHWDGTEKWLWSENGEPMVKVGGNRESIMLPRIDRMIPGDMPAFEGAVRRAAVALSNLPDAAVKHMIVISDGDPVAASDATLKMFVDQGIKISTVAVGGHGPAGHAEMQRMANVTGGKYYVVNKGSALPKIYQAEARRVARPLIHENKSGFKPTHKLPHEMTKNVAGDLPSTTGYVLTQKKESPLVEVAIVAPEPADEATRTILASWTFGLGKAVAFTSDAGHRWATDWTAWSDYDKLFSQIVRWSMRPAGDQGKFSVSSEVSEGRVRTVITALDKDDQFLNFLDISGSVIAPDMQSRDVTIRQTAPGRYVSEFEARESGSYFMMISPGSGMLPVRVGVNVPYSPEFLDRETDEALLRSLVVLKPKGGEAGVFIDDPSGAAKLETLLEVDTFRQTLAPSSNHQDVWHLLLLAASCVLFSDVLVRRVHINFAWVKPIAVRARDALLRREPPPPPDVYLERLRSRKAEIAQQVEQRRAATRFEPSPEAEGGTTSLDQAAGTPNVSAPAPKPAAPKPTISGEKDDEGYTGRLLKAKRKVWDERNEPPPDTK